ncbi:hypothetical protein BPAE_0061g00030 [Botrytis paeoniae]|uniref:Uncharacterized protein n=1 Tax=Botrytis paeoniae TaxID=278948 RepID=A0A4Z1FXA4_9HELO|nr:hypothetical protein BPAE_0061g00030 [Botrytis paeoniae]
MIQWDSLTNKLKNLALHIPYKNTDRAVRSGPAATGLRNIFASLLATRQFGGESYASWKEL